MCWLCVFVSFLCAEKRISNIVFPFQTLRSFQACYINGSPQNTFVPGVIDLAEREGSFLAGDDLKSGQTKLKSVLVDFLISAGLKPTSIVSYNHLGNNDGMNLSSHEQFRSKEISKSNVVDDMVQSNSILYKPGEKPDHTVSASFHFRCVQTNTRKRKKIALDKECHLWECNCLRDKNTYAVKDWCFLDGYVTAILSS